jgi:hypothetical protein
VVVLGYLEHNDATLSVLHLLLRERPHPSERSSHRCLNLPLVRDILFSCAQPAWVSVSVS